MNVEMIEKHTRAPVALVTGANSGLGWQIAHNLIHEHGFNVISYDHNVDPRMNVASPDAVQLLELIVEAGGLDVLVNCAGVNRIGWLQDFQESDWDNVIGVNAKGIFKMSQACLPYLKASGGTILNIVSNAAHMPMRCSLAYNASKGAALIMTKQLARELTSQGITVFSVSPNKLANTGMSRDIDQQVMRTRGWSLEETQKYQLAGLLTGEETPPQQVAEFIGFLLSSKERHKYLSGCDIPYGA